MMMTREHPRPDPTETDWHTQAACLGLDPNLFHPTPINWYGSTKQRPQAEQARIARAKAICATCPVGDQCETDGNDDTMSIRNGKLPEERVPNPTRSGGRSICGTDAHRGARKVIYRRGEEQRWPGAAQTAPAVERAW